MTTGTSAATLTCTGCGTSQPGDRAIAYPFRCARAEEQPEIDHVLQPALGPAGLVIDEDRLNPFLRYRRLLHAYKVALEHGMSDVVFVDVVQRLDDAIAGVAGHGFVRTPVVRPAALHRQLGIESSGSVWIKDETGNVAGSHKARHLMGVLLYLEVIEALGLDRPKRRGLAIASCGNAALAAAVLAAAARYPLQVFVPAAASEEVLDRIRNLGAVVTVCARQSGSTGDPTYRRFRGAVAHGMLPFCCQGPENGLTIEGGATLWLELAESLADTPPEHVFVQVGGGALASACVRAFDVLRAAGRLRSSPAIHAVQTAGAYPLKRAYDVLAQRMATTDGGPQAIDDTLRWARSHRSSVMRPWETQPRSIAHGILDDETYDWAAVIEGMLRTGGVPLVVNESELRQANGIARDATGIHVGHTGSAGLAGLVQLVGARPMLRAQRLVTLFSGRS